MFELRTEPGSLRPGGGTVPMGVAFVSSGIVASPTGTITPDSTIRYDNRVKDDATGRHGGGLGVGGERCCVTTACIHFLLLIITLVLSGRKTRDRR